jgi:hypothetical protein
MLIFGITHTFAVSCIPMITGSSSNPRSNLAAGVRINFFIVAVAAGAPAAPGAHVGLIDFFASITSNIIKKLW